MSYSDRSEREHRQAVGLRPDVRPSGRPPSPADAAQVLGIPDAIAGRRGLHVEPKLCRHGEDRTVGEPSV